MRCFFLPLALLVTLLAGCAQPTDPETEIKANIATMELALAERDNSDFMDHLAESFIGGGSGRGDLTRDDAQKMVALYFLRYKSIRILVTGLDVEIDPYEPALALSTSTVALSGGERLIPNSAGLYRVSGQWQNFDGSWKLTRLEWE